MTEKIIALLGRRDYPTDGVADYCQGLSREFNKQNYNFQLLEFAWQKDGIFNALKWLWHESKSWQNTWVLLQYTNFSWFLKGFPFGFLIVIFLLKIRGCRVGFICHERYDFSATRFIDKLRRNAQFTILKLSYHLCERIILTLPKKVTPWLGQETNKAVMIPVGSGIDINLSDNFHKNQPNKFFFDGKTVVIFGITGGNVEGEVHDISYALKMVYNHISNLRLLAVGRDTDLGKKLLVDNLSDTNIIISIYGLLSSEEIAEAFLASDVFLFVRGCISTGRSSAIAGVVSQLPMVAYSGEETDFPLTESGIIFVPQGDKEKLAEGLIKILTDDILREDLRQRSIKTFEEYFSWEAIVLQIIKFL